MKEEQTGWIDSSDLSSIRILYVMAKVIIVLTNHGDLGKTGNKTGWYLPEVAHPYKVFKAAGWNVTFVSPKGGKAPMDPGSGEMFKEDKDCQEFLSNAGVMKEIENTKKPNYAVIFYAGGHGPMWDLADDKAAIYENNGIVGAVCHGTVGLCPVFLSNGSHILKDKSETKLTDLGAKFIGVADWQPNVQADGRVITGQNPNSATPVAKKIVEDYMYIH
ncbi:hypothetical protein KUTeg_004117, partial [Tegillarca granosa]